MLTLVWFPVGHWTSRYPSMLAPLHGEGLDLGFKSSDKSPKSKSIASSGVCGELELKAIGAVGALGGTGTGFVEKSRPLAKEAISGADKLGRFGASKSKVYYRFFGCLQPAWLYGWLQHGSADVGCSQCQTAAGAAVKSSPAEKSKSRSKSTSVFRH